MAGQENWDSGRQFYFSRAISCRDNADRGSANYNEAILLMQKVKDLSYISNENEFQQKLSALESKLGLNSIGRSD